jgi:hypothetical protein
MSTDESLSDAAERVFSDGKLFKDVDTLKELVCQDNHSNLTLKFIEIALSLTCSPEEYDLCCVCLFFSCALCPMQVDAFGLVFGFMAIKSNNRAGKIICSKGVSRAQSKSECCSFFISFVATRGGKQVQIQNSCFEHTQPCVPSQKQLAASLKRREKALNNPHFGPHAHARKKAKLSMTPKVYYEALCHC